jgi:hypothetical protein
MNDRTHKAFRKKDLYILKAAINGFTAESHRIRAKEIDPKHLEEKARGWDRKRSLGLVSRFHQLAYAYMLGRKYSDIEPNRPLKVNLWQTARAADEIVKLCKMYGGYRAYWCKELDRDAIINWFKTDENIFRWMSKKPVKVSNGNETEEKPKLRLPSLQKLVNKIRGKKAV